MFTPLMNKRTDERGALMIEAIALLGLMTMMSPMVVRQTADRTVEMEDVAIAGQMKELKDALSNWIEANYASIKSACSAGGTIAVAGGAIDLAELRAADSETAKKALKQLNGIGDKVANCVVLFGLNHMEAFPVDVWIRRALKEHFPPDFDPAALGDCAGLAQQYIFYYARSHGKE